MFGEISQIRTMDGGVSAKSYRLCDDTPFVIDELQSRECQIVDTGCHRSKRSPPE
jgi:hypothetical protein